MQYESVSATSMAGTPMEVPEIPAVTQKLWYKPPYMKIESTAGPVINKMIVHPDATYLYNKAEGRYERMDVQEMMAEAVQRSPEESIEEIKNNQTLREIGTETIDGKSATVIEYTNTIAGMDMKVKTWLWNEKGLPLRMESSTEMGGFTTTTTTEFKNFVFGDIPDSMFDINNP